MALFVGYPTQEVHTCPYAVKGTHLSMMQVQHLKPVRLLLEQHAARGQAKVRVQKPLKAMLATPRSNELLSLKLSKLTNYLDIKMSLRDNIMVHL